MGKKGFLKALILRLVDREGKITGYSVIKRCEEYGMRVSAGSVYPALSSLVKEGFLQQRIDGRRKVYSLTDEGKELVERIKRSKRDIEEIFKRIGVGLDMEGIPEDIRRALMGFFLCLKGVDWKRREGIEGLVESAERLLSVLRRWKNEGD